MTDEAAQRLADAEDNKKTYSAIMDASAQIGVPAALGLTMFFTQLVLANGVFFAAITGFVTAIFSFAIVKLFFSH